MPSLGPNDATILRSLWRAILIQAARDAAGPCPTNANRPGEISLRRHQVAGWIGTRDFTMVCSMAEVAPDRIACGLRALLATPTGSCSVDRPPMPERRPHRRAVA